MNLPSWPDVTNARETEEKRKGKSKIERPDSDVDAQNTETNDYVAFWDTFRSYHVDRKWNQYFLWAAKSVS